MIGRALVILLALALASCGGSGADPESGAGDGSGTAGDEDMAFEDDDMAFEDEPGSSHNEGQSAIEQLGITPPDSPWAEMSMEEKEWYMVGKVLPIMQELFRNHDAEKYAEITCETCHGENMREVNFAMPSGHMMVVGPVGTPGRDNMANIFGETVGFMEQTVTPTMATLLGAEEASSTCAACHPGGSEG